MRYVAFLRGINLGSRTIKMNALKKAFEDLGFEDIKTILASGNVLFSTTTNDTTKLTTTIEEKLQTVFNHIIYVLIRSEEQIKQVIAKSPFQNIKITHDIQCYVTFLYSVYSPSTQPPFEPNTDSFHLFYATPTEVYMALEVSTGSRTVDAMTILEKEYGKKITTRNWNTILRIQKALA